MSAMAPHVPWRAYLSGLSKGCKDAGIACFEGLVRTLILSHRKRL